MGAALLALAAVVVAAAPAAAHTANRTKPVVFVHGLDWQGDPGVSCSSTFGTMMSKLRALGYTGTFNTLGYYQYDTNCTNYINGSGGNPGKHYATNHSTGGTHNANTDIRHLGYHVAWWIYNTYSSRGVTVDVAGHSMGGLILRYAISEVERRNADFPPYLYVEDALTMGSPHGGAQWYSIGCLQFQCQQMRAGSSFLVGMESTAWEPDGSGGTDWTTFGSDDDAAVAADRAVGTNGSRTAADYFGSCHKVWYTTGSNLGHSDFMNDTSDALDADAYYEPGSCFTNSMTYSSSFRHAVRQADLALYSVAW
jgi:hypothetical protein